MMATKARVVVAGSSVSASQMKDFWSKAADGTIDGEVFGRFLASPRKLVGATAYVTLARAINILGAGKVITAEQAVKIQELKLIQSAPLRFTEETLRERAEANGRGETDWRLVYVIGRSPRELRDHFGIDRNHQPCFYPGNTWWLESAEDEWAKFRPDGRYYLINFNGRFGRMAWQRQEEEIRKLGPQFRRAHEAVVTEAAFYIFKTTSERLLETWWHWGQSLDSRGYRVFVGFFGPGGWGVFDDLPGWRDFGGLRVCLEEVPIEP